jgi:ribosomal protein S18 acetylase RimI-like enzyme
MNKQICGVISNVFGHCYYAFEHNYVHIYNLKVFPDYRRQGKAKELLQITINEIRKKGYTGSIQIVAIPQDNSIPLEKLKSFYKDLGLDVFEYYG